MKTSLNVVTDAAVAGMRKILAIACVQIITSNKVMLSIIIFRRSFRNVNLFFT